jgi:GNAT superfamily N-acetyltransferase
LSGPFFHMVRAGEDDWEDLYGLRLAVEERLHAMGGDQWSDTARGLDQLSVFLNHEEVHLVRFIQQLAGAFALTPRWDRFWDDDPERGHFLYLHKVMTHPAFAGQGVGTWIVSQAMEQALVRGYTGLGFTYLRTSLLPGRSSGVLMEMRL